MRNDEHSRHCWARGSSSELCLVRELYLLASSWLNPYCMKSRKLFVSKWIESYLRKANLALVFIKARLMS
jgi:hypothetical protein